MAFPPLNAEPGSNQQLTDGQMARQRISNRRRFIARSHPELPAIVGPGLATMTYAAFDDAVEQFAAALIGYGLADGDAIGVCLPSGASAAVAAHAVLQVGATAIPLAPDQPTARTTAMVEAVGPSMLIVSQHPSAADRTTLQAVQSVVPSVMTVSLAADGSECELSAGQDARGRGVPSAGVGDALAYVMFTSGSTGQPKGVMVTPNNLEAFLDAWTGVVGSPDESFPGLEQSWLWLTSSTFDPVVVEMFWTLTNGATVVVPEQMATGPDVASAVSTFGVTHLQCTPTRASLFLADPFERAALGAIRHLMVGGEALSSTLARSLMSTGVRQLTNLYGPTETTVWAFAGAVERTDEFRSGMVSIGRPTNGTIAVVVDGDGRIVPPGVEGELWLGGDDVALGYVGQPDLSAATFVDVGACHQTVRDAVASAGGSCRLYRTGDSVCETDGVFWFRGRRDGQVKIRGHRIEIPEVEAAIQSSPLVRQAAVVATGVDGSPDRKLVGFVVADVDPDSSLKPEVGQSSDLAKLRAHCATRLAPTHIPTEWRLMKQLPLTATGKVDRLRLSSLVGASPSLRSVELPPAGELTEMLAALFAEIIGSTVGPADDFFASGGDSVGAVELFARIHERLGHRFPLRFLADTGSAGKLADRMHKYDHGGNDVLVEFNRARPDAESLYIVHGAGGTVIGFAELAAALAPDVSLVGVQAIGTDGAHVPDVTLQAMAQRYADAIADHHRPVAGGRVWIGGYSDGGVIALHTAAALVEKGLQVQSVLLLDAFLGTEVPRGIGGRLGVVSDNLFDHPARSILRHAVGGWRGWRVRYTTLQRDHDLAERMAELGHRDLFDVVLRACRDAGETPLAHRLSVSLIRCAEYNPFERHNFGWIERVADTRSVSWTSGHHLSMLRSAHAIDLAAAIRAVRQSGVD